MKSKKSILGQGEALSQQWSRSRASFHLVSTFLSPSFICIQTAEKKRAGGGGGRWEWQVGEFHRLQFPASLAVGCGHVTESQPMEYEQKY